jgi:hypothetical protein
VTRPSGCQPALRVPATNADLLTGNDVAASLPCTVGPIRGRGTHGVTLLFVTGAVDPHNPETGAQRPALGAAHTFLQSAVRDGDLLRAWPHVDPILRTCWAQHWLHANQIQLRTDGYDRDEVVQQFAAEAPEHPLWTHFRRITVRSLRASVHHSIGDSPENWEIGAATRVLAADTELLYVHDTATLPDGVWQPDTYSRVVPMVMRFGDNQWRVLNVGAETIPEPGWPPRLWTD